MAGDVDARISQALGRLLPRVQRAFSDDIAADPSGWSAFSARLERHFPALFSPLVQVYGDRYDFFFHLEQFVELAARSWFERAPDLRTLDDRRESDPAWFQSQRMLGGVCYVDLFAEDLAGIRERIPYFQELGLTYLHLMPLFRAPEGNSDGGYAVSSYREVDPKLGSMVELRALAAELRAHGISLVLDFVFNHTSDEHPWAEEARRYPDDEERNVYLFFPNRSLPDAYDATLREIFPDQRPGSFTWVQNAGERGRWVWTTFHSFQWDLNYANPTTFARMAGEMLFLANQGVEILRLDAVAFIWKQLGTVCESLPEAHLLVRAFNAMCRIAAPALLFKSEAIVHPAEVASYIDPAECQLSYNPLQMATGWEMLATREPRLLTRSLAHWYAIPDGCAWVNYVRSHDDIGWTFDDADAGALGINGYDHRRFLNQFYTGRFPGSFARGRPFQENPKTGDARISGTAASLAGLEKALAEEGPDEVELALKRVLMLYSLALSLGGIPLIYLGDELATLNDDRYLGDHAKAEDSRWVHRVSFDEVRHGHRHDPTTPEGRLFTWLTHLIAIRKQTPALAGSAMTMLESGDGHVVAYTREHGDHRLLAIVSATEAPRSVSGDIFRVAGFDGAGKDLISGTVLEPTTAIALAPYQILWLQPA